MQCNWDLESYDEVFRVIFYERKETFPEGLKSGWVGVEGGGC